MSEQSWREQAEKHRRYLERDALWNELKALRKERGELLKIVDWQDDMIFGLTRKNTRLQKCVERLEIEAISGKVEVIYIEARGL